MAGIDMTGEVLRNRLLRRVDWRFLLPSSSPRRSVCFSPGEIAEAVALISETVADPRAQLEARCDLAVAVNPRPSTLLAAHAALQAGGWLYVECHSPTLSVASLRRRLAAAGFVATSFFTPQSNPSRSRPDQWIPLDNSGALRYAVGNRGPARTSLRQIGRALRNALRLGSAHFRWGYPICALAEKGLPERSLPTAGQTSSPARATDPSSIPGSASLEETIRRRWTAWGLGDSPTRISVLLLTGGLRSVNKVIALAFAGSETVPRMAIKMPRVPESQSGLIREAETLQALQRRGTGMGGVPKVLFCERQAGTLMIGQTVVAGRRLSAVLAPHNARALARRATTWQLELAAGTEQQPESDWWNRLIEPVITSFQASFGPVVDPGMLREAVAVVQGLRPLPVICEQRDFAPWNLLLNGRDELAVLDWESSELHGLPALDLIYFLTYLGIYLDGAHGSGRYADSYRATLMPSTRFGATTAECLEAYASQVAITPADLRPLRLLTWMLHSRSTYRHLTAEVLGPPAPGRLRTSLFIQLWEAEMRYGENS